jgi:acid phosphatase
VDAALRAKIDTVVVIYAENRSFNNLFADFPGLEQPLSAVPPERARQRDRDGRVLETLPKIWDGMVPDKQVVEHAEFQIGEDAITGLPNGPFALKTPEGDPLPHGVVTRDLIHSFYNNQWQINGGRNDGFVAWGDSGALVMGHYGDVRANLRLWQVAREFTLCDNFFMGAFGGSFLNHQYLVAATPPFYPDADKSPAKDRVVKLDPAYGNPPRPLLKAGTPASAMDGPVRFVADRSRPITARSTPCCPLSAHLPGRSRQARHGAGHRADPAAADPRQHRRSPDRGWRQLGLVCRRLGRGAGRARQQRRVPLAPQFPAAPPAVQLFRQSRPGHGGARTPLARCRHGRNRAHQYLPGRCAAGKLPPVTFYKPQGNLNMHAGYSDVDAGDRHIAGVIDALRRSPQWDKMLIVVTFDENGGWWDHVAPPKGDRWGRARAFPR